MPNPDGTPTNEEHETALTETKTFLGRKLTGVPETKELKR